MLDYGLSQAMVMEARGSSLVVQNSCRLDAE
jgi:hypothetical protein